MAWLRFPNRSPVGVDGGVLTIAEHLHELFESDQYNKFVPWLLEHVLLTGFRAVDGDNGYCMSRQ